MFWADDLIDDLIQTSAGATTPLQVINDSKTPSGRVHIGALRGVVLHDVLHRVLGERSVDAQFYYGFDDMDPFDAVPPYLNEADYSPYLGKPLWATPPPDPLAHDIDSSYAEFYASEFIEAFSKLGIHPTIYRTSELYRAGRLNDAIRTFLDRRDDVRRIYYEVSGSVKDQGWYPFNVICERCGKIATTVVTRFNGTEVTYLCSQQVQADADDIVIQTTGCGFEGSVSPFDGRGKLPWKLEWPARWAALGVTLEGAGKDHSTAGGARDVSAALYRQILQKVPPYNAPYEFWVEPSGKKLSTSMGRGLSAADAVAIMPPEILRFLITRRAPSDVIRFEPGRDMPRLFDEYDLAVAEQQLDKQTPARRALDLAQLPGQAPADREFFPRFSLITTLLQTPWVDLLQQVAVHKQSPLTAGEQATLTGRLSYMRAWLGQFAPEDMQFSFQKEVPNAVRDLSIDQRRYLRALGQELQDVAVEPATLNDLIRTVAETCGVKRDIAFQALYVAFLGKPSGPRLVEFLIAIDSADPGLVHSRLLEAAGSS